MIFYDVLQQYAFLILHIEVTVNNAFGLEILLLVILSYVVHLDMMILYEIICSMLIYLSFSNGLV